MLRFDIKLAGRYVPAASDGLRCAGWSLAQFCGHCQIGIGEKYFFFTQSVTNWQRASKYYYLIFDLADFVLVAYARF